MRAAASRELGSLGRLVGFSAGARDVLANPPSTRAILSNAARRMASAGAGASDSRTPGTSPAKAPAAPGPPRSGALVTPQQGVPGGFGHFRAGEEILAKTRLLDFRQQSQAEDRVMRTIGYEGTLGGAVARGTESLRAVAGVGTGAVSPFSDSPSTHGTPPAAYLRALMPGFGPMATVQERHREEALASAILRQRQHQLLQGHLRAVDPRSHSPPRSGGGGGASGVLGDRARSVSVASA